MDFATRVPGVSPLFVSSVCAFSPCAEANGAWSSASNLTWVANYAVFVPIYLPGPFQVRRWSLVSANVTVTENIDIGVYCADSGSKLSSLGSTSVTWPAAANCTFFTATPALLPPGRYYLGITTDGAQMIGVNTTQITLNQLQMWGFLGQASAFPLPADLTGASIIANDFWPFFGMTQSDV